MLAPACVSQVIVVVHLTVYMFRRIALISTVVSPCNLWLLVHCKAKLLSSLPWGCAVFRHISLLQIRVPL